MPKSSAGSENSAAPPIKPVSSEIGSVVGSFGVGTPALGGAGVFGFAGGGTRETGGGREGTAGTPGGTTEGGAGMPSGKEGITEGGGGMFPGGGNTCPSDKIELPNTPKKIKAKGTLLCENLEL
ncbi:hypothetical protein N9D63_05760 [Opitutales bacterium]|nr:hypothetical protein [Opitutales bacterium]